MSNEIEPNIRLIAFCCIAANLTIPASVVIGTICITNYSIVSPIVALITSLLFVFITWLINRRKHPFIDESATEALNFTLSIYLYLAIWTSIWIETCKSSLASKSDLSGILMISSFAIPILFLLHFFAICFGSIRADGGKVYKYPLSIRFLSGLKK
jgi:uncharacterized protein